MKSLDIPEIFKSDADEIIKCREDAIRIHGSNIRAAGNEVEICVREYFERMLPPKYYIGQGHIIDIRNVVSSQLDIIISDNSNLPSLMTTKDGTEYIPGDSVYSIGEIKSTYQKSKQPIQAFSKVLRDIRDNFHREELLNTAFGGITGLTLMRDVLLSRGNQVLNRIYFFMMFVDGGDFEFEDLKGFYSTQDINYLPNVVVLLNKGIIIRASYSDETFSINRYPEYKKSDEEDWYYCPFEGVDSGSLEGNHLGYLYYSLIEHLTNSYLEPPSLKGYLSNLMIGRKTLLERADTT
jgi:hypothetical protein